MKLKFIHCKMPKSGQDSTELNPEFANKLSKFLMWIPRSILELSLKQMYKESYCFKEMIKNLVDGKE